MVLEPNHKCLKVIEHYNKATNKISYVCIYCERISDVAPPNAEIVKKQYTKKSARRTGR